MSHLSARINNFMLPVRNFLEWCLLRPLSLRSIFLQRALSILRLTTVPNDSSKARHKYDFDDYYFELAAAISKYGYSSSEATSALNDLRVFSPLPHVQVTGGGVWNHVSISIQTHLKSTFDDAVANIESTGRILSLEDKKYLQLLLTHPCGWSATYPKQKKSHWATFFKICYPQIKRLVLILDNMTYPEEFKDLPDGRTPERAELFLLATPESYYVFDCAETPGGGTGLSRAGQTLEEVYLGMKEYKHMDVDDPWEIEEIKERVDYRNYFPQYHRNKDGIYIEYEA